MKREKKAKYQCGCQLKTRNKERLRVCNFKTTNQTLARPIESSFHFSQKSEIHPSNEYIPQRSEFK